MAVRRALGQAFNLPPPLMNLALISTLVAVLAAAPALYLRDVLPLPLRALLWHTAVAGLAVALAASTDALAGRTAGLLGKVADGRVPWPHWFLFLPFHAIVQAIKLGYRLAATEPLVSEVAEGWFLGGCPSKPSDLPPGPAPALLDVTCEMPRCKNVGSSAYKLLACWETHGLQPDRIQEGVAWALQQKQAGRPVYVFCTHGHGRSAVLLCALLVADGLAASPEEAWAMAVRARPGVRPNARQRAALERWCAQYGAKGGKAQ